MSFGFASPVEWWDIRKILEGNGENRSATQIECVHTTASKRCRLLIADGGIAKVGGTADPISYIFGSHLN